MGVTSPSCSTCGAAVVSPPPLASGRPSHACASCATECRLDQVLLGCEDGLLQVLLLRTNGSSSPGGPTGPPAGGPLGSSPSHAADDVFSCLHVGGGCQGEGPGLEVCMHKGRAWS